MYKLKEALTNNNNNNINKTYKYFCSKNNQIFKYIS